MLGLVASSTTVEDRFAIDNKKSMPLETGNQPMEALLQASKAVKVVDKATSPEAAKRHPVPGLVASSTTSSAVLNTQDF